MRIISWNVNGYRSLLRLGHWTSLLKNNAEILCFQETKYEPGPLEKLFFSQDSYRTYWHLSHRKGYAGVAVFTRVPPHELPVPGIGVPEFDSEGRVLRLDFPEFSLINVYFPHSHRELLRLPFKLKFCAAFDAYLRPLEENSVPLVICGDFNIAHTSLDLTNYRQNRNNAGFLREERAFIDRLLARGYIDVFRHFHAKERSYTWWSQMKGVRARNVGWRLDYFFVTSTLVGAVRECRHLSGQLGSDHCPVLLELNI